MKSIVTSCVLGLCAGLAIQEPQRTPQDPPPAKQAQDPAPVPGKPARDPLEGVYKLQSRVVDGRPDPTRLEGYVAITSRHILLVLAAAGTGADSPLLRAGVRTWQKRKDGADCVVELGFFTDADGEVHVEPSGGREVRRIDLLRGMLRIWQDTRSYLEFARVE